MTTYYYILFTIFAFIFYVMSIDSNVSTYLNIIFKLLKVNYEKLIWLIRFHPKNPITNLIMRFKYNKIAKDLHKELNQ
jgi:hypothetical protein